MMFSVVICDLNITKHSKHYSDAIKLAFIYSKKGYKVNLYVDDFLIYENV